MLRGSATGSFSVLKVRQTQRLLKKLFLRIHPDLVGSHSEVARRDNEKCIKVLNGLLNLFHKPREVCDLSGSTKPLTMHVLNEDRTKLTVVRSNLHVPHNPAGTKERFNNFHFTFLQSLEQACIVADVKEFNQLLEDSRREIDTAQHFQFETDPDMDLNFDETAIDIKDEISIWDDEKGSDIFSEQLDQTNQVMISRLFRKNRIHFAKPMTDEEEVDMNEIVGNIVTALRWYLSHDALASLHGPLGSDLVLFFGGEYYSRVGRSIVFPHGFCPEKAADHLEACLEEIKEATRNC
mmetsp:Transcript_9610/g.11964  ORF Transcript_9610/g.11964 Transcript_9610/m.11964 type:complete len:294 (-) Transcript_9610:282-1163(-)